MSRPDPVYLDYNATAPIRPEARDAILMALQIGANASSVHAGGRAARAAIETARLSVAELAGGDAERVVFTSGGAEANTLAVMSAVAAGARRLLIGATEHATIPEAARATGLPIEILPVDRHGVADLDWLRDRLARWNKADGAPFLALMAANNETGAVQPVAMAAELIHALEGRIHVDAVAAAGKLTLDLETLDADTLSISAHKIGGPQGVGALLFAEGVKLARQIHGGGHERGLRAGTENLSGIVGFGAAATVATEEVRMNLGRAGVFSARQAAAARLAAAGAVVVSDPDFCCASVLSLAAPDFPSHLQVMALDLEGVMVSAGSACSSGKVKPSGVYEAMGLSDLAGGALRASGGWATTAQDWTRFADVWLAAHERHTRRRSVA